MSIIEALLLGLLEGVTEFLPVSSTGHLTIAEKLLGYRIDDPSITAFTAIIQVGAVLATLLYFRRDLINIVTAWITGLFDKTKRENNNYRFGWAIIIGSAPIAVIGLAFKDQIETTLRSLWFVAIALIAWSGVMWLADRYAKLNRHEPDTTWRDTLIIGLAQCLALIPGVSRSGATMSAGLFRGLDRVTVTRLSFFLSIPALVAAGLLQSITKYDQISGGVGWPATLVGILASFAIAYVSIAWLLRFVARHSYNVFIVYRLLLGSTILMLLITGVLAAK